MMKFLLTLALTFTLMGCNNQVEPESPTDTPNSIDAREAGADAIDPNLIALLGDNCGPTSGMICASGLSCQFEGLQQEAGKCLPVVANPDLECDETQAPVCGLIGNNKNGYLNECFARRFGAVVLNKGLCKTDETIKNNCEARSYSIGNCQNTFQGAYFNRETKNCENVRLIGCDADIPFESLASCSEQCG